MRKCSKHLLVSGSHDRFDRTLFSVLHHRHRKHWQGHHYHLEYKPSQLKWWMCETIGNKNEEWNGEVSS